MGTSISELRKIIEDSDNIVFFGGAGVSTESGIPDFRGVDGLYNQEWEYPPEVILSHDFFVSSTEEFYRFYKKKMLILDAEPNPAHNTLARLEEEGKLRAVITQNIDGLHQKAGSENVFELHGSVHRNYCMDCGAFYDGEYMSGSDGIPGCCNCGGIIKPDVVLYGEQLRDDIVRGAIKAIEEADVLIIGGTSLSVYPAAGFVNYYRGRKMILINKTKTPMDSRADYIVQGAIGEVLSRL